MKQYSHPLIFVASISEAALVVFSHKLVKPLGRWGMVRFFFFFFFFFFENHHFSLLVFFESKM